MNKIIIPHRELDSIEKNYISKIEDLSNEKIKFDNSIIGIKNSIEYVIHDLKLRFEKCKNFEYSLKLKKEHDFIK